MTAVCSRCGRSLRHPIRWAGLVLGEKCARAVGAAAVSGRRFFEAPSHRRAAAVVDPGREVDPRQLVLELEEAFHA
ncbi:hypothetical protein GCM10028796_17280 [Ramlibacter monticola]|uniref:Uncharacterized protein n=1 Tax=Ramlibacter monticola TaxID=1926872 RepID=A0A936YXU5_9BURK|nr:hypothetical protein [Ramlibacter monticola]MBL0390554.1 hypothetical protein [Ramlibacter monticola]